MWYNPYQSWARFYAEVDCSLIYNNKILGGRVLKKPYERLQHEHRGVRPNEATTPEMKKKIHKMVLDDRRLKVRELTDTVSISKSVVHRKLAENLDMKNLWAPWVPPGWMK